MSKKETTIDDLAIMVQKGFNGVDKKIDDFEVHVNKRFEGIEVRLNRIEKSLIANHERRIEKLEDEIVNIRGLLTIQ